MTAEGHQNRLSHLRARVPGVGFGGDYNPEQWPAEVWAQDMELMRQANVNLVSVGIFSWALVEPRPGEFQFDWVDRVLDTLAEAGVSVALATMTASPPPWLSAAHPEMLPVRADGARLWPGGRQHYCPSSPVYREHAARLVDRLAARYGEHPALALWHIGNEYGCHVTRCWCDVSAEAFRRWLADRYGDIEALNEAWSTAFWSQRYDDFSQIQPPRIAPAGPNPAQQIDFRRFSSDELLACYRLEREICRRHSPHVPATTNFFSLYKEVDFHAWAPSLDIVSHDSYPDPFDARTHVEAALQYDVIRSVGGGAPWLLMEQAPSAVNWRAVNAPKPPGVMRLWSYQALARGADSILYFQWRQSRGGSEKFHSAMVPHGGTEVRTHRETRELGEELRRLGEVTGSRVRADVALILDWSSWWGLEQDSHPSTELSQYGALLAHYGPLWDEHVTVDVVAPDADLTSYRLVVVPNLYMVSRANAARLRDYVAAGGHLVMSFFSGIVDECDRVHLGGYPAPFRELLGLRVDEFWPLPSGDELAVAFTDGGTGRGRLWSEWIELEGAEALATFADGELAGRPAVTRHAVGHGMAWYLGTRLDGESMGRLTQAAFREAGVRPVLDGAPDGVEAVIRHGEEADYLFLLNHGGDMVTVDAPPQTTVLIGSGDERLELEPRAVAVLQIPPGGGPKVATAARPKGSRRR